MSIQRLEIATSSGAAEAVLALPKTPPVAGVLVLTDVFGIRPAYEEMAERIAGSGYAVLMPNIFYRTGGLPVFDFVPNFQEERTQQRFKEITTPLTPQAMEEDASAYVDFLASKASGPIGVVGFCFSGKFALRTAAARPDRVRAAASFHGGGLYTEEADSPHRALPQVKASLYFGHAENDRSMPPEAIEKLDQALKEWGGSYKSETYAGAAHGWMIPGREVYNQGQSERGFAKLMDLFDSTLRATVPEP